MTSTAPRLRLRRPGSRTRRSSVVIALVAVLALVAACVPVTVLPVDPVDAAEPALHDGFDRPDDWQMGTTETGQAWQVWSGTAVVAGQMAAASVPGYTLAVADSGTADGSVSVSVPMAAGEAWLVVRATDAGNYWRFGRSAGGPYELQQIAGWWFGSPVVTRHAAPTPQDGDRLQCHLASTVTCSVDGVLVASSPDPFNATATHVGFATADPAGPPATRFDDITVEAADASADVAVALMADEASVAAGGQLSWTATVSNEGTLPAADVHLLAAVPAGSSGVQASSDGGSCTVAGQLDCDLGALAAGARAVVTVVATAPSQPGSVTLVVSTTTSSPDADEANDTAQASVVAEAPIPEGAVVVDDFTRPDAWSMGSAPTGQTWEVWQGTARVAGNQALASEPGYTLAVLDSGTSTGSATISVPTLGSDFWVIARASNSGNYWRFGRSDGGGYELQQIRDWALGAPAVTVLGTVTPSAGDTLECRLMAGITCSVNGTAVASSADTFNSGARHMGFAAYGASVPPVRFDAFRVATPSAAPDLVAAVTATNPSVLAGQAMGWTATVRNGGSAPATGVQLAVTPPAGLGSVGATPSAGSCSTNGGLRCSLGTLAPGDQATVTFSATAPSVVGTYVLAVQAGAAEPDGDPSTDRASAAVGVRVLARPGEAVADGFNRPNASTLGTTPQGRPWQTWTGSMGIVANQAGTTTTAPGWSSAVIDPGFTFGTVQVRLTAGASQGFQLIFRGRDAGNHYRLTTDADGHYRVEKLLEGRIIGLQFNAIRANVRATDGDRIRIVNRPDDGWFIAINGVHVLDGGDVDLFGEHHVGLAAASPAVRFDDLSISQVMSTGLTTTESFAHPAESVLELRTPTAGTRYTWRTPLGHWVTRSGGGVLDSPGFGQAYLETSSQLARVQVTVRARAPESWVLFRYAETGAHYRFGHEAGGRYRIERLGTDGQTLPVPGGVRIHRSQSPQANDRLDVRQAADGTISAHVNGVLVASAKDTVNGTQVSAYGIAGAQGASFDDLVVTAP
jgi:uncharacterized repeat protein (TIGR01451 family)